MLQAEAQARRTLAPELHEWLSAAVALVQAGQVLQTDDRTTWVVASSSRPGVEHRVNGTCPCEDAHYRAKEGLCKHRLGVYLARRVLQLIQQPPAPVVPEVLPEPWPDNNLEELTSPPAPRPAAAAASQAAQGALPEAPASVNCHITLEGRQVQVTLRDADETRLLQRLQALLKQYPVPAPQAPTQPQGQDKEWCAMHQTRMKQTTKDGRSWYSHRVDGRWCKGRA